MFIFICVCACVGASACHMYAPGRPVIEARKGAGVPEGCGCWEPSSSGSLRAGSYYTLSRVCAISPALRQACLSHL